MKHQYSNANVLTEIGGDWLEQRRRGIGGTDISAIAGLNPWRSALTVYYEKRGELPGQDETERMRWGNILEPIIIQEVRTRHALKIDECPYILAHPDYSHFLASPDAIIIDPERGNGVLEVKTMGHWSAQQVRSGTEEPEIPNHYLLQLQWYLFVTGLQWGMFAVLLEGQELVTHEVKRDDELIAHLAKIGTDFWKLVEAGTPPAADGSDSTTETIKALFPEPEPESVAHLDADEFLPLLQERDGLKSQIKNMESRCKAIENQIKLEMENAEIAAIGDRRISYKIVSRKGYTVEPKQYRQLTIK